MALVIKLERCQLIIEQSIPPQAMSDSFNTYENDFQLALQEAKTKTSQVESVQGGMSSQAIAPPRQV